MSVTAQAAQWLFSALLAVTLAFVSFVLRSLDGRIKGVSDTVDVRTRESLNDRALLWEKVGSHGESIATLKSGQAETDRRLERIETKIDVLLQRPPHG